MVPCLATVHGESKLLENKVQEMEVDKEQLQGNLGEANTFSCSIVVVVTSVIYLWKLTELSCPLKKNITLHAKLYLQQTMVKASHV